MNQTARPAAARTIAIALMATALTSALVACGGSGSDESKPSAASSSAAPTPTYTEPEGCRNEMQAVDSMATTLEGQAPEDADVLAPLVRQAAAVQERLETAGCSTAVYDPFAEASYQLALAGATAQACKTVTLCDKQPITESVVAAAAAMRESLTASDQKDPE